MKHLVLVAVALWVVSACSTTGDPEPTPEPAAGCGECTSELAALEDQIVGLDTVAAVTRLGHQRQTPTNGDTVSVELELATADSATLADDVVRLVWLSDVEPVSWVDLVVMRPDGSIESFGPFNLSGQGQGAEYEEQWGPRPGS